jgi:hypothetical protein
MYEVQRVNDVRQAEIHKAKPLVPQPSAFKVEMAIEKQKRHKPPSTDQIPANLIKAGGRAIFSEMRRLINSIWTKEKLLEERESIIVPIRRRVTKQIVVIIETHHFCQLHTKFYPTSFCPG